jgi:hypothetical protein
MKNINDYADITQTDTEVPRAELAKIESNTSPLTLDFERRQEIETELERRRKIGLDPRGCGKPRPAHLYWQRSGKVQDIDTSATEHCGDRRAAAPFGSPSALLCEDCVREHGLIW